MIHVLTVVLWVSLSGAQPFTTVPTSVWPPEGGCVYEGKFYAEGETISEDPYKCYGVYCHRGLPVNWDAKCFFYTPPCDGWSEKVLGQCCPVCHSTSQTPTTTSTSSSPHVPEDSSSLSTQHAPENVTCIHNGSIYKIGQSYWDDRIYPCKRCQCTDDNWSCNSVECRGEPGSASCASDSRPPGNCCPSCAGTGSQMFAEPAVFCTAFLVFILKYFT